MEQDFRWVTARHACSPFEVYKLLQSGCERDIEERNALRKSPTDDPFTFKLTTDGDGFYVLRQGERRIASSVAFNWTEAGISVLGNDRTVFLEATLTLNDEGECRLKVGAEELSLWQFRKRALEDLFFNF